MAGAGGASYDIPAGGIALFAQWDPDGPTPVTVNVSGSQTYGDASPILTTPPRRAGSARRGTLACTKVAGTPDAAINSTLAVGTYTVDPTTCSGLTGSNYSIGYAGVGKGFVVNPILVTVNVSGSQTYGDASPILTYTTTPSGISLGGPWPAPRWPARPTPPSTPPWLLAPGYR